MAIDFRLIDPNIYQKTIENMQRLGESAAAKKNAQMRNAIAAQNAQTNEYQAQQQGQYYQGMLANQQAAQGQRAQEFDKSLAFDKEKMQAAEAIDERNFAAQQEQQGFSNALDMFKAQSSDEYTKGLLANDQQRLGNEQTRLGLDAIKTESAVGLDDVQKQNIMQQMIQRQGEMERMKAYQDDLSRSDGSFEYLIGVTSKYDPEKAMKMQRLQAQTHKDLLAGEKSIVDIKDKNMQIEALQRGQMYSEMATRIMSHKNPELRNKEAEKFRPMIEAIYGEGATKDMDTNTLINYVGSNAILSNKEATNFAKATATAGLDPTILYSGLQNNPYKDAVEQYSKGNVGTQDIAQQRMSQEQRLRSFPGNPREASQRRYLTDMQSARTPQERKLIDEQYKKANAEEIKIAYKELETVRDDLVKSQNSVNRMERMVQQMEKSDIKPGALFESRVFLAKLANMTGTSDYNVAPSEAFIALSKAQASENIPKGLAPLSDTDFKFQSERFIGSDWSTEAAKSFLDVYKSVKKREAQYVTFQHDWLKEYKTLEGFNEAWSTWDRERSWSSPDRYAKNDLQQFYLMQHENKKDLL